ncbi:centrosomal protein of 85 kDa-like isoform X1 [Bufo gargarizans]|uniref:centrosomal protein of 85 kDa-like isoform X1 n=2 Tax=Bufo gargarizans TaxID=30331 RepID=UPI001CF12310|nr:centrosomal protein of 85 kDa-like isoform X1 [Bufo gargarizans]XP_044146657.1 centrosomal protein of 85 kDa-like isoform X1 [Bufo gargarizans]
MWGRMVSDYGSGFNSLTTGADFPPSGWLASSLWHSSSVAPPSGKSSHARRHSITSDSGDTGIGTSCSDSLEDHSTSSGTSTFKPVNPLVCLPSAHVMPSTVRSSLPRHREDKLETSCWDSGYSLPGAGRTYGHTDTPLDMKDSRPMKKWSSLSKLSTQDACGQVDKAGSGHSLERMGRESSLSQQSRAYRPACLHYSMEALKLDDKEIDKKDLMDIDLKYKYDSCRSSDFTRSAPQNRRHTLDMTYSALPESKPSASDSCVQKHSYFGYQAGTPLQSSLRTQMWLSDQLHANSQDRRTPEEACCLSAWNPLEPLRQDTEVLTAATTPTRPAFSTVPLSQDVSKWESLLKIKEGLIRQKEIVIDRQRQQIGHLQQAIRGSELRSHPASTSPVMNGEDSYIHGIKGSPCECCKPLQNLGLDRLNPLLRDRGELEGKLSPVEVGVAPLNEVLKHGLMKPSEDLKKMEEKIKTRDKYINSLRKKCQKENDLNREKQRRIETLEKYVADLPTLEDVQRQSERLQVIEEENKQLKDTIKCLEKLANESRTQFREKEAQTECQKQREKELVLTVQSLQQKVQKCLEDGVRLPMLDTKQLQSENERLQEQTERANKVIDNQQSQIDSMTAEIQALREKLFQRGSCVLELEKKFAEQPDCTEKLHTISLENKKLKEEHFSMCKQLEELLVSRQPLSEKMAVAEQLFKEMSHCLFDLKALCSILNQRVQGKEPNLSLLLGIRSASSCSEESEASSHSTESLTKKLADAWQLRKDIDELRTTLSDCYAQDMGDNCITQ